MVFTSQRNILFSLCMLATTPTICMNDYSTVVFLDHNDSENVWTIKYGGRLNVLSQELDVKNDCPENNTYIVYNEESIEPLVMMLEKSLQKNKKSPDAMHVIELSSSLENDIEVANFATEEMTRVSGKLAFSKEIAKKIVSSHRNFFMNFVMRDIISMSLYDLSIDAYSPTQEGTENPFFAQLAEQCSKKLAKLEKNKPQYTKIDTINISFNYQKYCIDVARAEIIVEAYKKSSLKN